MSAKTTPRTAPPAHTLLVNRAIPELGDAMPVLDKAAAIFKAIQRLSDDKTIQSLAQSGADMLAYQWACIDDTLTEVKRLVGVQA